MHILKYASMMSTFKTCKVNEDKLCEKIVTEIFYNTIHFLAMDNGYFQSISTNK